MKRLSSLVLLPLLALLLLPCPALCEDTNEVEEAEEEIAAPAAPALTPLEQVIKYRDDMSCAYNMTNYLKEVIVVMQPVLAEPALAEFLVQELPNRPKKAEFLKKWAGQYRTILTNGFGFRLIFQLRNNFLDLPKSVTVPKDIADHFSLINNQGVKVKAYRCVSDKRLPQTLCFGCHEVSVELYFNTHDESGRPLIAPNTKAIRLQSSAVNADFGSYNFSWWLPFKYPIRRPAPLQSICGSAVCRTFVPQHPKVFNGLVTENVAFDEQGRRISESNVPEAETAAQGPKQKKEEGLPREERQSLLLRSITGLFLRGLDLLP